MKKILTIAAVLFCFQAQAQLSSNQKIQLRDSLNRVRALITALDVKIAKVDSIQNARLKMVEDSTIIMSIDSLKKIFDVTGIEKAIENLSIKYGEVQPDILILKQYMILQKQKYLELSQ